MPNSFNFKVSAETEDLELLIHVFPFRGMRFLKYIANAGAGGKKKGILYEKFLTGQYGFTLSKYPTDVKGRRTVTGTVMKRRSGVPTGVRWKSYPLNLFERGRVLRSGAKEKGKYLLTRKFANQMQSQLQKISTEAKQKVFEEL